MQTVINELQAFGVPGQVLRKSPTRVDVLTLATVASIGLAVTKNVSTAAASLGGTGVFGGILVNTLEQVLFGGLSPSLALPVGATVEALVEGDIVVSLTSAANIGDQVEFSQTDGTLQAIAPGAAATAGYTIISNAVVKTYQAAAGLAWIHLDAVA